LKNIFATIADQYDVLIFDCPPNMTLLSENIIMASDQVVMPVIPTNSVYPGTCTVNEIF